MSIVHIPFYPSDWLAGTRNLSDAETGVYITLLAHMYEMAGPIEREDNRLYRMCGCKSKSSFVKSLEYLISQGKITSDERGLFNDRVQKEIEKVTEKSSSARAAAQSRWDKKANKNNATPDANASHTHMRNECQPEPKPEPKVKRDTNVSPKNVGLPFSAFWDVWPNRNSKAAAEKAWKKLSPDDREAAAKACVDWFSAWRNCHPEASPILPSTFLNNRRWEDEAFVGRGVHPPRQRENYSDDFQRRFAAQQIAHPSPGGGPPNETFRLIAGGAR